MIYNKHLKTQYLLLHGGFQVNWFVRCHKLFVEIGLGSGCYLIWCILYFADDQTASVPILVEIPESE